MAPGDAFPDHFSSVAAGYAAYRPHYPPALIAALAERCAAHDVAWDVGCGSGQLSVALATRFTEVIATDPAAAQLAAAAPHPRVRYRQASAEASGLADASVDLIVAAQAAHWFRWPAFTVEALRVARPGGLIALVSYGVIELDGPAGAVLADCYHRVVAPFWPPERRHVEEGYRELTLPLPELVPPAIAMIARWPRPALVGYVETWSATAALIRAEGRGRIEAFARDLAATWPDDEVRELRWPLTVRLFRR